MRWLGASLLLVAGCDGGTGGPRDSGPHAYMLLRPATEQQGWAAIQRLRAELPSEERRHIRTAGLVSSDGRAMYVEFDGTCAAPFVAAATRVMMPSAMQAVSCRAELPGALQKAGRVGGAPAAVVLFRLGRDRALDPVRRSVARGLSFYQRAPVHVLAEAGWGEFDWMMSSLMRWALVRLCARRARYWRRFEGGTPPSSGWPGSLLVVSTWTMLVLAAAAAFPVVPNALID